ncbi:hypothetical protein GCM10009665_66080 [Kitasatospora nipponensis]|uniref:D-inositol 3-phosphate glycosyltransferase n=1 Tax=Kitasatospora nipponensis TaxID=258049 RepID=A0ABP4HID5_9ACTN
MAQPPSPPRVLHVITDPRRRGAQRLARDLHAELLRRGRPSALRALAPHPDATGPAEATGVLGPSRYHRATLRALLGAARRADVVVAHGSSTLAACAVALAGTGVPFVYVGIGDPRHWSADRARRLLVGLRLRRCSAVTALTHGAREVLLEHFPLDPRRVVTIPNARAADRYPPAADPAERSAARTLLGLPGQGPLVAWVGALAAGKRPDLALTVTAALPGVHLALAGAGPLRVAAGARVTLLGELADPAPLYRAADALLLTSDSEGLPGVLIEAALAGLPCAATDVGWVREIVRDGVTGALAPAGDAPALRAALAAVLAGAGPLGSAARHHALRRFDLAQVTDRWQELLLAVARGRPVGE